MVRFLLRIFAGLFGVVFIGGAITSLAENQWAAAAISGVFALFALRYAVKSSRRVAGRGSRRAGGRTTSSDFDFLEGATTSRRTRKPPAPLIDNEWPAKGDFGCDVVGESNYQPALIAAVGSPPTQWREAMVTAELVCERNNQYDPKAVAVLVNGQRVGYLSRDDARSFRIRLERRGIAGQATRCGAMIRGGGIGRDGTQRMYGIYLDIQPFR